MISERVILLRIKDLEQRRGRISLVISPKLIHLIKQHEGVFALRLTHSIHYASWHRAYIGFAVTADIRFILYTAERNSYVISSGSSCNRPCNRCFSDTWRANKTEYLPLNVGCKCVNRYSLNDSLFHLFHAVVIGIEDLLRMRNVAFYLLKSAPGKLKAGVEVSSYNCRLLRVGRHFGKSGNLFGKLISYLVRNFERHNFFHIAVEFSIAEIVFSKFF